MEERYKVDVRVYGNLEEDASELENELEADGRYMKLFEILSRGLGIHPYISIDAYCYRIFFTRGLRKVLIQDDMSTCFSSKSAGGVLREFWETLANGCRLSCWDSADTCTWAFNVPKFSSTMELKMKLDLMGYGNEPIPL